MIEGLCLAVEFADLAMHLTIHYIWVPFKEAGYEQQTDVGADILYMVLLALITTDWILAMTVPFSYEYLVPIRPLLPVVRNESVRNAAFSFIQTLVKASNPADFLS